MESDCLLLYQPLKIYARVLCNVNFGFQDPLRLTVLSPALFHSVWPEAGVFPLAAFPHLARDYTPACSEIWADRGNSCKVPKCILSVHIFVYFVNYTPCG